MTTAAPTIDGFPLMSGKITEPVVGAWVADVTADHDEAFSGQVTIIVDGVSFVGTVRRSSEENGKVISKVVAGAGELSGDADAGSVGAKAYRSVNLGIVLTDLLTASGETLDSTSETLISTRVPTWQRAKASHRRALEALVSKVSLTWRVLRNGNLWLGTDTWPEFDPEDVIEIDGDAADGVFELRDAISMSPGVTYRDQPIRQVVHTIDKSGTATEAWVRPASGTFDQLKELLRREADYDRPWACTVVSQNADYSLELLADDERLRGSGIDSVHITPGLPGVRVQVPAGARCYIEFAGGDPAEPRVTAWDAETALTLLTVSAGGAVDFVALAAKVLTELGDVKTEFAAVKTSLDSFATAFPTHVHTLVTAGLASSGPTVTPGPSYTPTYDPSSVAATTVKVE